MQGFWVASGAWEAFSERIDFPLTPTSFLDLARIKIWGYGWCVNHELPALAISDFLSRGGAADFYRKEQVRLYRTALTRVMEATRTSRPTIGDVEQLISRRDADEVVAANAHVKLNSASSYVSRVRALMEDYRTHFGADLRPRSPQAELPGVFQTEERILPIVVPGGRKGSVRIPVLLTHDEAKAVARQLEALAKYVESLHP